MVEPKSKISSNELIISFAVLLEAQRCCKIQIGPAEYINKSQLHLIYILAERLRCAYHFLHSLTWSQHYARLVPRLGELEIIHCCSRQDC